MSDTAERWDCSDLGSGAFMESCENGDWVNFADYAARAAERDALRATLEKTRAVLEQIESHRRLCMRYDEENGHVPRTFDEEDLRIMEIAARAALKEIARAV